MNTISKYMAAFIFGLSLGLVSYSAYAGGQDVAPVQKEEIHHAPRAYFQALFGASIYNFKISDLEHGFFARNIHSSGMAYHLSLGYQIFSRLGVEFGVAWLKHPDIQGLTPGNRDYTFKNNMVYLAGTFNFPIIFGLKLFGLGGVGYVTRSIVRSKFGIAVDSALFFRPVYGAGVLWQVFKHWALVGSWLQMPGVTKQPSSNFFGLGFRYRFYV